MGNFVNHLSRLKCMLEDDGIPFEIDGSSKIYFPSKRDLVCEVLCDNYSLGHKEGLLEIAGLVTEEESEYRVLGCLTAEEVFKRIKEYNRKDFD